MKTDSLLGGSFALVTDQLLQCLCPSCGCRSKFVETMDESEDGKAVLKDNNRFGPPAAAVLSDLEGRGCVGFCCLTRLKCIAVSDNRRKAVSSKRRKAVSDI